jgi:hypothetical protein
MLLKQDSTSEKEEVKAEFVKFMTLQVYLNLKPFTLLEKEVLKITMNESHFLFRNAIE